MVHSSLEVLALQQPKPIWTPPLESWMERVTASDFVTCWVVSQYSDYQGPAELQPSHLWPQFLHLRNRIWS